MITWFFIMLGCGHVDDGDTADDTNVAETDLPRQDTAIVRDTAVDETPATNETIFEPIPGVVVDRGSPAYGHVTSQSTWCMLAEDTLDGKWDIMLIGMEDGVAHRLVQGMEFPPGFSPPEAFAEGNSLAHTDQYLFFSTTRGVARLHVDTMQFSTTPLVASGIAHYGSGIVLSGRGVYRSWKKVLEDDAFDSQQEYSRFASGETNSVYDFTPSGKVRRYAMPGGEARRSWDWDSLERTVQSMSVVTGPMRVVQRTYTQQSLVLYDLEADRLVATFGVSGLVIGPSCEGS